MVNSLTTCLALEKIDRNGFTEKLTVLLGNGVTKRIVNTHKFPISWFLFLILDNLNQVNHKYNSHPGIHIYPFKLGLKHKTSKFTLGHLADQVTLSACRYFNVSDQSPLFYINILTKPYFHSHPSEMHFFLAV